MRVSANGGTPELVIPAKEGEQVDGPQLLPDGDSVLFSVTTASGATRWDTAQIVVQSLSTGNRNTLLQGGSAARYVSTGHLVYALRNALFAVAFDVDQLEVSGGPVSVIEGVARAGNPMANTATANYAISDRGTLVYLEPVEGGFFLGAAAPLRQSGLGGPEGPGGSVVYDAPRLRLSALVSGRDTRSARHTRTGAGYLDMGPATADDDTVDVRPAARWAPRVDAERPAARVGILASGNSAQPIFAGRRWHRDG